MMEMDFMVKYKLSIRPATKPPVGKPKRDGFTSNITIPVSTTLRIPCPAHPVAPLVVPAEIAASVSGPAPAGSGSSWKIHP